jgi:hypothetical protein
MKNKTLRERVAQEIDRASKDGNIGSIFDIESSHDDDPDIRKYKDFLLLCADRIIKMVQKDKG